MAAQVQALWQNAILHRSFDSAIEYLATLDDSTLVTTPSVFIIAFTPIYVRWYRQSEKLFAPGLLLWLKLATSFAIVSVQFLSLLSFIRSESIHLEPTIATLLIAACAAICLSVAINIEHRHAAKGSAVMALWLLFSVLCDAFSLLIRPDIDQSSMIRPLIKFSIALKSTLMLLEELPKAAPIIDQDNVDKPDCQRSFGFWSRSLWRMLPTTVKFGFSNQLSLSDLDDIGPEYFSERLALNFHAAWAAEDKQSKYCLHWALFRALKWPLLAISPPRILYGFFSISQVVFIHYFFAYLESKDSTMISGLAFFIFALVIHSTITVCRAASKNRQRCLATLMRGTLTSAIYAKVLKMPYTDVQKSIAVNLTGSDVEIAARVPEQIHELIVCVIEVCACVYVLMGQIGVTAFSALAPLAVASIALFYIGKYLPAAQKLWNHHLQERVSRSLTFLSQIRAIRIAALEHVVSSTIIQSFAKEIKSYVAFRSWSMLIVSTTAILGILPLPAVLGAAIYFGPSETLSPQKAITIVAMIALFEDPVLAITGVPAKLQSLACFHRLQDFLLLQEATDPRITNFTPNNELPATSATESDVLDAVGDDPAEVKEQSMDRRDVRETEGDKDLQMPIIRLQQANIAPHGSQKAILRNVDISFQRHELVAVAGSTSTGKSTFLRFLIGEATRLSGTSYVEPAAMAYCDQRPWLRNTSFRNNIINDLQFDQRWYNSVVHACMLDEDFVQFTAGDEAIISINGTNLSNGQRQRLALARCLYIRAPYLILDNVFGSLDNESAEHIFQRLFSEDGLLAATPATVILTTHSARFIKAADQAVFIHKGGVVSCHRDFESSVFQSELKSLNLKPLMGQPSYAFQNNELSNAATSLLSAQKQEQENLHKKHGLEMYLIYLLSFDPFQLALWLPCIFIGSFSESCTTLFMRLWFQIDPENNMFLMGYVALSISTFFFSMLDICIFFLRLLPISVSYLHIGLIATIARAKMNHLTTANNGVVLNHLIHDMSVISHTLPTYFVRFSAATFTLLGRVPTVATSVYDTLICLGLILGTLYVIQRYYLRTSRQIRYLDLEHRGPLLNQLTEMSSGLQHIRAFRWQEKTLQTSFRLLDVSQRPFYHSFTVEAWLSIVMDLFRTALVLCLVAGSIFWKGTVASTTLSLLLVASVSVSSNVRAVIHTWAAFDTSLAAFARIHYFITTTPIERNKKSSLKELPRGWPRMGNIEMKNVTAQYDSSAPAVTDVSMLVTEGKRVGIAGRTGSGKSSLLLTLLNFIGYTGEITIDGVDISKIPRHVLRTRITTITQELIVLEGTVRYNLCPWNLRDLGLKDRVPDFSMITFLESLGIWAHIESEGGLDAELSEIGLSEGQMQLFSVARGMVHNLATSSRIVILDEPTSNLDPAAEEVVMRVLKDALYDHSILLLSHNPKIMPNLDSVIRMENGRIVEDPDQDRQVAKDSKSKSSKSAGKKKAKSNATASSSTEPQPVEPYYQKLMDHMDNPTENPPPFPPRRTAVARLKRKYKRTYGIDAAPTWL